GRDVHAVDLVLGHITLDPLNLRPHLLEHLAGVGADGPPVLLVHGASAGEVALDHELRHGCAPSLAEGAQVRSGRRRGQRGNGAHGSYGSYESDGSYGRWTRRSYNPRCFIPGMMSPPGSVAFRCPHISAWSSKFHAAPATST